MKYEIILNVSDEDNSGEKIYEDLLQGIIKQCLSEVENIEKSSHLSSSIH